MKLQISFDSPDLERSLTIAAQVAPYADILELGALLLYMNGISALAAFKEKFEDKVILVDSKIVDRGKEMVNLFSKAGAQWVTVMGGTDPNVIHSTANAAHSMNTKIMLDLLDSSSVGQTALEAKKLGANALLFHQPYDAEDSLLFLDKWDMIKGNTDLPIFVSAQIKRETVAAVLAINPAGIVIGRSIVQAESPATEAQFFREMIDKS